MPSLGGQIQSPADCGPRDRRPVERRDDVLVYTGQPLADDLEVTGPIYLTITAATSAPDTDLTAALVDVHPTGPAVILCEGIQRARFRASLSNPTLIEPGRPYRYRISMWETSLVFRAGHRIRLEVSSSNFPRFDRNPNTGHPFGLDAERRPAHQTVFHDAARPSFLTLPVVPG